MNNDETISEQENQHEEEKFINKIHDKEPPISESEVKSINYLNKYYFEKIFSDYLYKINFPKDCELEIIGPFSFSFPGKISHFYSLKFPPSLREIKENSLQRCMFLDQITFLKDDDGNNNLEIIDNFAFLPTIIESISIPENIKEIGCNCFPPTLKSVTFEKGAPKLEKIGKKAFFNTKIEKFLMPLKIKPFINSEKVFFKCSQLKTIIFDSYFDVNNPDEEDLKEEEKSDKRIECKTIKFKEIIQNLENDENEFDLLSHLSKKRSQDFAKSYLFGQTNIENLEVFVSNLNYFYFYNTSHLTNISIPKSDNFCKYVKHDGILYTKDMAKLIVAERNVKKALIDSKCKIISNYAFNFECFEKVSFGKNSELQEISVFAFSESNIKEIKIPETVDFIDYGCFYRCNKLQKVNISPLIEILSPALFLQTKLTEITIPKSVIVIEYACFFKCANLNKVIFENNSKLLEIHALAFSQTNIETIAIPKSVKNIDDMCFRDCKKLKSIQFDSDSQLRNIGYECFKGTLIEELKLPKTIEKFQLSHTNLKKVSIDSSSLIKSINFDSTLITEISIPPSVKTIYSFYNCPNLTTVKIIDIENSKLKTISDNAFLDCTSLVEFQIPKEIVNIGSYCFKNCINYKAEIDISNDLEIYINKSSFENSGIVSFKSKSKFVLLDDSSFKNCSKLSQFICEAPERYIFGKDAFLNCTSLKIVKLTKETEMIDFGENCFQNSAINEFDIPSSLSEIPNYCFKSCKNLTNVKISDDSNITCFGIESFYDSNIQSIFIPSKCKHIKKSCFENCKELKKIDFSNDVKMCSIDIFAFASSGLENFDIPVEKSILQIEYCCFEKCKNLKTVSLPFHKYFSYIPINCFEFSGIKNIVLPSSIIHVFQSAFCNCKKLQSISFKSKMVTVLFSAFSGCCNLKKIEFNSIKLFINDEIFLDLKNNNINEDIIAAITSTSPVIHDFSHLSKKYDYFIDDKMNFYSFFDGYLAANDRTAYYLARYLLRDTFCKIYQINDYSRWPCHFIESKDSCYYINNKEKLVCCDFFIESINILKETQIIKSNAFKYSNLKKISFEKGSQLKKIKKNSFENLLIEEISIPDSVILIDDSAFKNCKLLNKVTIKKTSQLETIGNCAFERTSIETILFPSTLTNIGESAFYECFNLKTVDNYSNMIKFGCESFYRTSIEKIKFPKESYFDYGSFYGCSKLKQLTFLEKPIKIVFGEDSFSFSGLEELKLKCSAEIHRNAFSFCKSLKKVHIVGNDVLCYGCSFLSSNINATVIEMTNLQEQRHKDIRHIYDSYLFNDYQLDEYELDNYTYFNDLLLTNIDKCSITLEFKKKTEFFLNHKCYVFNNSLIYADLIDNNLLYEKLSQDELNQESIKKNEILRIPSKATCLDFPIMSHIKKIVWGPNCSIEKLSDYNFSYYSLVEITIPKLIETISPHSFENCHFLKVLEFENGCKLKEIKECAFANTSIKKIVFPKTVDYIGKRAFCNINNLEEVHFEGRFIDEEAFSSAGIKTFNLSNNVTKIAKGAFQYCRNLTQFNIDIDKSNLEIIGSFAFSETSIERINIPNSVKVIKKGTFCGCERLKIVNISENSKLTTIKDLAFAGNLLLERINLPKTVIEISYSSFINTPLLKSIMNQSNEKYQVNDDNSIYLANDKSLLFVPRNLKKFEVPSNCHTIHSGSFCGPILEEVKFVDDSLKCIENNAFAHSTALKEITIPKSITFIGDECFIQCESLEKVEFDSSCQIKQIPKFCFAFSGVKTIILPSSIEIIEHSSFFLCQNLKFINLYETRVKYISDYAFSNTIIEEIKFPSSINFISSHIFDGNKSLKLIDLTDVKEIDELKRFPKDIPNLIQQSNTKSNEDVSMKSSTIQFETPLSHNPNQAPIIAPFNKAKISMNKSANVILKTTSPQIFRPSLTRNQQQQIISSKTSIKTSGSLLAPIQLPEIGSNKTDENETNKCFIHSFAFCNSSVKTLKVKLTKYEWFNFINNFSQIEEYVINDEIHLILQKLPKENCKRNRFISSLFDIKQFFLENETLALNMTPFHFVDCSQLTSIMLGNEIKIDEIPKNCFAFSFLKEMSIPSSIQTINQYAFKCCYYLEKFIIPNNSSLKKIKTAAFCECKKLASFYIPNNVKVISKHCFSYTALEKIDLPNSIRKIKSYAFYNCKQLKEVNLNNGINLIGSFAFANNDSLETINLPDSLKTIKSFAFSYCINLSVVKTTENTQIIEIYNGCFENTQIEEICINRSAIKLFEPNNVPKLNRITFCKGKPVNFIQLENGTIYEKTSKFDEFCKKEDDLIELESNIIKILSSSKSNNIKELNLNNLKIALIKNQSKNKHPLLNLVFAPKNLECLKIHEDCFQMNHSILNDMKNLTTIEYMKGSTNSIIDFPYYNHLYTGKFNNLKHIRILGDFAFIKEKIFADFESLETIEFGDSTNVLFIPKYAFLRCKNLQKIVIPSSCYSIEEGSFKDCINLHSIEFKNNSKLRFIGKSSFCNCSSLESILIPSSINSICAESFMNCIKLAKVEFESSQNDEWLKTIEKNAFKNCSSLSSFILPKTCSELGPAVFMNCTNLEAFEYEGTELKTIPCRAFFNCSSLKKIELTHVQYKNEYKRFGLKSVTIFPFSIGDESFMNCTSLKEVIIEDGSLTVKLPTILKKLRYPPLIKNHKRQTIRKSAFCNCRSLEKARFYLGNLERFHSNSFMNCEKLKLIEINSNYSDLIMTENLDLSTFIGTPKDLQIKIYSESELIKTIENFNEKPLHKSQKKFFKEHLSSLNKSLFEWNIQEDKKSKKLKSTCINAFDGHKFRLSFTYKCKDFWNNRINRDRFQIPVKGKLYIGHSDPLENVNPIRLKSRHESKIVTTLNDCQLVKPDENGRIKKPDIVFNGFRVPVFKSVKDLYKENLSKLNRSFLAWPLPDEKIESPTININLNNSSKPKNNENSKSKTDGNNEKPLKPKNEVISKPKIESSKPKPQQSESSKPESSPGPSKTNHKIEEKPKSQQPDSSKPKNNENSKSKTDGNNEKPLKPKNEVISKPKIESSKPNPQQSESSKPESSPGPSKTKPKIESKKQQQSEIPKPKPQQSETSKPKFESSKHLEESKTKKAKKISDKKV